MKYGRFINGAAELSFDFNGRRLRAHPGDSVSSALWRNGVTTITRSFKYHRRRGVLSLSGEDANTVVDAGDYPNINGDNLAVTDGMLVRSRHYWGTLENDRLAAMQLLSPLLMPGFYYRAFYRPRGAWRLWEPLIRRLAGIGEVNLAAPHAEADKINAHCDVAVVGGGPAGVAAAIAAAAAGKQVALLDKHPQLGGAANYLPPPAGFADSVAALPAAVRVYSDCRVTGLFADNLLLAVTSQSRLGGGLLRLRAEQVVVATGARDIPPLFVNNDLPGVMLTQAAVRLAGFYDVAAGKTAVLLAASAFDAAAARMLRDYGINFAAVFAMSEGADWADALREDGFNVLPRPTSFAARGGARVSRVDAESDGRRLSFPCDCLLMSGGRTPKLELPATGGAPLSFSGGLPVIGEKNGLVVVGAAAGRMSPDVAAKDAAAVVGGGARPPPDISPPVHGALPAFGRRRPLDKTFIDFEEDLQPKDMDAGIADGFSDSQLLKRYTTAGMGLAQGKLGNLPIAKYLAAAQKTPVKAISTPRPPFSPETLAQLAGPERHPLKRTVLHENHRHLTARMMIAGEWYRPAAYTDAEQEATALREGAGMIDVSTLGKIRVRGKNAAELLERLYTGKFVKQPCGTVRYALMLDESGIIADDGISLRLDDETFWVTTTTGNAAAVYRNMLLWSARWDLGVEIVNMTSAYAAINVAGPYAAEILSSLFSDVDWEIRYMRGAQITLGGAPALIMRIGFVGEKGYEIHLPAGYMPALWKTLAAVESPCRLTPCGVEAQRLLRLEKGHIIIAQDTDGLTVPAEVNMNWAVADKPFFLGSGALAARASLPASRRLVGFCAAAEWRARLAESDLILHDDEIDGRVTSVSYSPILRKVVGLAFVSKTPPGGGLAIRTADGIILHADCVKTPFYDPTGERQK